MNKMLKKLFFLLLTLILLICINISAIANSSSDFAGGSGTEDAPYLISTKEHLDSARNYLNAHFKLICDIEFTDASIGWTPIGTNKTPFTGVFDGNGHSIRNLYVSSSEDYVGLFGYNEGTIKNLSLIDADVHGYAYVGGSDYSDYVYAGTIAGYSNGSILKCCSFGKVYATGTNPGTPTTGTFYRAYVYAGGITGFNVGVVENCYNNCDVSTKSSFQPDPHAGGIAGKSTGSIITSYNLGDISSSNSGGIVGEEGGLSSANCYYSDNVLKGVGSGTDIFTKCTLSSMSKAETFNGFDFTNVWTFDSRYGYLFPVLRNGYVPNLINTIDFVGGCGTETDPYLIETKEQLNNVRKFPKAHYKMISDIVFTASDFFSSGNFYNYGTGWEPIGSSDEPFSGFFDGNGHTIKGLYINTSSSYAGLFGYTNGTVQNLGINGCNITAKKSSSSAVMVGSIAGNLYGEGKIINCYNTGNIVAHSPYIAYAGGIVGTGSNIENCYNTGNINATTSTSSYSATYCNAYAGGIVGRGGQISTCYNTGNVTVSAQSVYNVPTETNTGGICGQGWDIYNSFNVGTISSTTSSEANTGGICGLSESITNCYNVGSMSSTSTAIDMYTTLYTGGIAGNLYSGMIINCYYLDYINKGVGFGTDFCIKCTGCEMLKESTYSEFDFDKDWTINKNGTYSLPVLKTINQSIKLPNSLEIGHTISDWIINRQATCQQEGIKYKECNNCKELLLTEKIAKTNHVETKVHGKKATCINTGLTDGKKCSVCDEILIKQTTVDKLEHIDKNKDNHCDLCSSIINETITTKPETTIPTTEDTTAPSTTEKKEEPTKVKKPAKVKIKKPKSTKKGMVVVQWTAVKNVNGYQVAYSTSKKFTKKTTKTKLIKKTKTTKTTLKKLKSGKKYFIKVRAYKTVNAKKLYGAYSKVMTVKVK